VLFGVGFPSYTAISHTGQNKKAQNASSSVFSVNILILLEILVSSTKYFSHNHSQMAKIVRILVAVLVD